MLGSTHQGAHAGVLVILGLLIMVRVQANGVPEPFATLSLSVPGILR